MLTYNVLLILDNNIQLCFVNQNIAILMPHDCEERLLHGKEIQSYGMHLATLILQIYELNSTSCSQIFLKGNQLIILHLLYPVCCQNCIAYISKITCIHCINFPKGSQKERTPFMIMYMYTLIHQFQNVNFCSMQVNFWQVMSYCSYQQSVKQGLHQIQSNIEETEF